MNEDIPLPFGLPAVSRLQAANDCFSIAASVKLARSPHAVTFLRFG